MSLSEAAKVAERLPSEWTLDKARAAGARLRRVVILRTLWYPEILSALEASAREYLAQLGVPASSIETQVVPGSFELPLSALQAIESQGGVTPDFVVALGCIVKGSTPHFDFVSSAAIDGLMRVQLSTRVPVGLGVLTVDTLEQAEARKDKGLEAAQAAFFVYLNSLRAGKKPEDG